MLSGLLLILYLVIFDHIKTIIPYDMNKLISNKTQDEN